MAEMQMKSVEVLTVELLSSVYNHNSNLYAQVGRTETSTTKPITAEQAAKDFKTVYEAISKTISI